MQYELLDYKTIEAAIVGNPRALQKVLDRYEPYMRANLWNDCKHVDPDELQELKSELIKAVLKWEPL